MAVMLSWCCFIQISSGHENLLKRCYCYLVSLMAELLTPVLSVLPRLLQVVYPELNSKLYWLITGVGSGTTPYLLMEQYR